MWSFIPQPGLATTVVDFTDALSPLLRGLLALVILAATGIAWEALRAYRPQPTIPETQDTQGLTNHRKAA